jgi:hypothetical protein
MAYAAARYGVYQSLFNVGLTNDVAEKHTAKITTCRASGNAGALLRQTVVVYPLRFFHSPDIKQGYDILIC